MNQESDVDFRKPKVELSEKEFKQIADSIYTAFCKL
jgi:hypothetical protein